ncbi:hypothetical protein [Clostridium sp. SHJSY1]|uniref:hypothetical protein n=1 Tax=Clostridium sp. SHJSY1 TaxID=2942483 RepID=UPI00287B8807|nr:hypothetical protein [Clostridium sp. SHJSY1]
MKKLVSKIMAVVVLFSLIGLAPQFTQKASASPAKTVSQFFIDGYVDAGSATPYFHEKSENWKMKKSDFPMLVETQQMGYGHCTVYLDGTALNDSECSLQQYEGIKGTGTNEIVGWIYDFRLTPNTSKLGTGTHTIKVVCLGLKGNTMSDSFNFVVTD